MKKLISIGALMLVVLMGVVMTGCDDNEATTGGYDYSMVRAYIDEEFYEKFDAKGFTLNDFNVLGFTNISSFTYWYFPDGADGLPSEKYISLKLKKTGKENAEQAIVHLERFGFVKSAGFEAHGVYPGVQL